MKRIGVTVLAILILSGGAVLVLFKGLDWYTKNGKTVQVPSLIGKQETEIERLTKNGLEYKISDSTYDKTQSRGIILNQNPKPFTEVKSGRVVYLTINCRKPKLIPLPDIWNKSIVYGISSLQTEGLKIGQIDTVKDDFPVILELKQNGERLSKSTQVREESTIDLVIGRGAR